MIVHKLIFLILSIAVVITLAGETSAQHRDYLTDSEADIVRDSQQLDHRVNTLVKIIDRRFNALGIDPKAPVVKKDKTDWGPEPTGTRTELLGDIKSLLGKAIDDIDNIAERPELMVTDVTDRKPKTFKEVLPIAVKNLGAAADRYKPLLQAEAAKTTDRVQTGLIASIIELCDEITASVSKLPAE